MIDIKTLGEHSSLSTEELAKLVGYPIMTPENVNKLQEGDKVIVLWCGGNGPHEYTVGKRPWGSREGAPFLEGCGTFLDFIGDDRPHTIVWCKSINFGDGKEATFKSYE